MDGNRKYLKDVIRASSLVLSEECYIVCLERKELVDVFVFDQFCYVARGSVKITQNYARVYNLFTDPRKRGKGYGTLVLSKCVEIAKIRKCKEIDALVLRTNKPSAKLHRKCGFKRKKLRAYPLKYRYVMELKYARG